MNLNPNVVTINEKSFRKEAGALRRRGRRGRDKTPDDLQAPFPGRGCGGWVKHRVRQNPDVVTLNEKNFPKEAFFV